MMKQAPTRKSEATKWCSSQERSVFLALITAIRKNLVFLGRSTYCLKNRFWLHVTRALRLTLPNTGSVHPLVQAQKADSQKYFCLGMYRKGPSIIKQHEYLGGSKMYSKESTQRGRKSM